MSKRHQASRRRSYGRREHELRERQDVRAEHLRREDAPGGAVDVELARLGSGRRIAASGFGYAD